MLAVPLFYAPVRWGDEWNVLRADGSRHRGHDIMTGSRNEVPALYAGRVVTRGYTRVLGFYIVLKTDHGYDYYCHLLEKDRPSLGLEILRGTKVGTTATWGDPTGSAWTGPHLHYGSGPKVTSVTSGATHDATKLVQAALTATAGGGTTPLGEEADVKIVHTTDTDEYFRCGELTAFKITKAEALDAAAVWGQVEIPRKNDFMTEAGLANSANDKLFVELVQKIVSALPSGSTVPTKITLPGPITGTLS